MKYLNGRFNQQFFFFIMNIWKWLKELKYCDLKFILKKRGIFMVYYVRNKVNMGVIGNAAGANAGFYDQIRIYCMWKAVRHVLTAFHCLWSTISCVLTHFMVFFMSHEYDTNPESVFPLSISIQPLLLLTKERQEHEKYVEYTHTHNHRWLPFKIYFVFIRTNLENNLMQQTFLPGLTLAWSWYEI